MAATLRRLEGVCLVAKEFRVETTTVEVLDPKDNDSYHVDPRDEESKPVDSRDKKRSSRQKQNDRKRKKMQTRGYVKRPAWEVSLCHEFAVAGSCKLEVCKFSHDIVGYYLGKRDIISAGCPNFRKFGYCEVGVRCMLGKDHLILEGEEGTESCKVVNVDKRENGEFVQPLPTTNNITRELQNALRKKNVNTDEELVVRHREDRHSMFKNKIYIAPLTTVGNLPFRRILKDLGADITCGEMALANNLCKGQNSEWALLRRHPCEDVFGVQIAGGDTRDMSMASYLIAKHTDVDFIDINCGCPIDLITDAGAGSALLNRVNKLESIVDSMCKATKGALPIGIKVRTGWNKPTTQSLVPLVQSWKHTMPFGNALCYVSIHGRSRQMRYTNYADWDYVHNCAAKVFASESKFRETHPDGRKIAPIPVFGNGDILSYLDWEKQMNTVREWREQMNEIEFDCKISDSRIYKAFYSSSDIAADDFDVVDALESTSKLTSCMIGRGALLKPWISTEIKESRHWDISGSERLDIVKSFAEYGLEHFGSDTMGLNSARRFLLEWLSFAHRYTPVGLIESGYIPQKMNDRPCAYVGRDDRENLLSSSSPSDWIKITELFLGKVDPEFTFEAKHKSSSYPVSASQIQSLI